VGSWRTAAGLGVGVSGCALHTKKLGMGINSISWCHMIPLDVVYEFWYDTIYGVGVSPTKMPPDII